MSTSILNQINDLQKIKEYVNQSSYKKSTVALEIPQQPSLVKPQ